MTTPPSQASAGWFWTTDWPLPGLPRLCRGFSLPWTRSRRTFCRCASWTKCGNCKELQGCEWLNPLAKQGNKSASNGRATPDPGLLGCRCAEVWILISLIWLLEPRAMNVVGKKWKNGAFSSTPRWMTSAGIAHSYPHLCWLNDDKCLSIDYHKIQGKNIIP